MKNPLEQIDEIGELIRQLHKIDSKLQAGQIIAAYRDNRRLIGLLEARKQKLIESHGETDFLRVCGNRHRILLAVGHGRATLSD